MADFVKFELDDGSEVIFESAESSFVEQYGGEAKTTDAGRLQTRLSGVAEAAEVVSASLREKLNPDQVTLEFGLKVSGEVNWWFFARNQAEGSIKVTMTWNQSNL